MVEHEGPGVERLLGDFQGELERQGEARHTPMGDRIVGAYCVAMSGLIDEDRGNPHIRGLYEDILELRQYKTRRPVAPSGLVRLSIASAQKQALDRRGVPSGVRYPHDYVDNPELWTYTLSEMYEEEARFLETDLTFDIAVRNLQSTVSRRYKGFKLPLVLLGERFGGEPRILDVGCSLNHGLKRMASHSSRLRFGMTRVVKDISGEETDEVASKQLRDALHVRVPLFGVGVEPYPVGRDEPHRKWIKSCSFYPSELLNSDLVKVYNRLERTNLPNVRLRRGNFAMPPDADNHPKLPGERFDMVTFSTVLYQLRDRPQHLRAMLENALRYVKEDGMIIVQDFVRLNPDFPHGLEFPDNWYDEPYGYRTLIFDMLHQDEGFQEFIRWKNGRCMKMIWGDSPLAQQAQLARAA